MPIVIGLLRDLRVTYILDLLTQFVNVCSCAEAVSSWAAWAFDDLWPLLWLAESCTHVSRCLCSQCSQWLLVLVANVYCY